MTNLNAVTFGLNRFCGPAVLSIVTGKSTDECANEIRKITHKREIKSVYLPELVMAAEGLGFKSERIEPGRSLFLTIRKLINKDGIYIILVSGHFVCIEIKDKHVFFCDNHTKQPMPAASSARLGMRVLGIYRIYQ